MSRGAGRRWRPLRLRKSADRGDSRDPILLPLPRRRKLHIARGAFYNMNESAASLIPLLRLFPTNAGICGGSNIRGLRIVRDGIFIPGYMPSLAHSVAPASSPKRRRFGDPVTSFVSLAAIFYNINPPLLLRRSAS